MRGAEELVPIEELVRPEEANSGAQRGFPVAFHVADEERLVALSAEAAH